MVESWLSAPLLCPSSSRMTVFQRCHVLSRRGCSARLGGQIARSLQDRNAMTLMNEEGSCVRSWKRGSSPGSTDRTRSSHGNKQRKAAVHFLLPASPVTTANAAICQSISASKPLSMLFSASNR